MLLPAVADRLLQDVGDDEILAHGLGGRAALGDDIEQRAPDIDDIEKRKHSLGVDIVLDEELGTAAFFGGQVVVTEMAQRGEHGNGTEGAAADAQHDEVVELLACARRGGDDVGDDVVLVVRKVRPTGHTGAAFCGESVERGFCRGGDGVQLRVGEPFFSEGSFHHIVEIELN